jgi:hypothetical protein
VAPLTDGSAILSTVTVLTFTQAFPPGFRYNAIALIINALIIANWLQLIDWPI